MTGWPTANRAVTPLSLYIHIPWCEKKCPYCDFNSHTAPGPLPEREYLMALRRDLEFDGALADGRTVETVFIGGGTPSLLSVEFYDGLLEAIRNCVPVATTAEVTLEANPGTVKPGYLGDLRAIGINRLSMGVQSFNDDLLGRIGRIHDARQALIAVEDAREAGFENLNLDLMFGLPGQDLIMARSDLDQAIALTPEHLSYYQLTIEPNTAFGRRPPRLPQDDLLWRFQEQGVTRLAEAGYDRYEVSAYTRGRPSRHNRNYWEFGDYLGIGAGAHGKATLAEGRYLRTVKVSNPNGYLRHAGRKSGVTRTVLDTPADITVEFMLNALRLVKGFPVTLFEERTGSAMAGIAGICQQAVSDGLLAMDGASLRPTALGLRYLDTLLERFVMEQA